MAQKQEHKMGLLTGTIGIYEGNCMPGPGVAPCEPRPISATILITKLTEHFDWNLLVDSVKSNSDGIYTIKLQEGSYSLFLRDGEDFVCTLIQCPDKCICHPFNIVADSSTVIDANLDHATW
jgi:hypothetical protein